MSHPFLTLETKLGLIDLIRPHWPILSTRNGSVPNSNKKAIWVQIHREWVKKYSDARGRSLSEVRDRIWAKMKSRALTAKKMNKKLDTIDIAVVDLVGDDPGTEFTAHVVDLLQSTQPKAYENLIRNLQTSSFGLTSSDFHHEDTPMLDDSADEDVCVDDDDNENDKKLNLPETISTANVFKNDLFNLPASLNAALMKLVEQPQHLDGITSTEQPSSSNWELPQVDSDINVCTSSTVSTSSATTATVTAGLSNNIDIPLGKMTEENLRFLQGLEAASNAILNFRNARVIPEFSDDGSLVCRPMLTEQDSEAVIRFPHFIQKFL